MGSGFLWKKADGVLMLHVEAERYSHKRLKGVLRFFLH